jgi:hypothetical protein
MTFIGVLVEFLGKIACRAGLVGGYLIIRVQGRKRTVCGAQIGNPKTASSAGIFPMPTIALSK